MASRKDQKEAARQRRLAEEQARAEHARRTRRLQMLGGVSLLAIIAVVAAVVISGSGGSSSTLKKGPQAQKVKSQVAQLLSDVPQSGTTLGKASAPVTMIYYGDLECPVCKDFTDSGGFPELVDKDVRTGKVKVVYRSFQTATRDPATFRRQQVAALAAGKQNHFWDYVELFYHQQGQEGTNYATEAFLTGLARQISGLNATQWKTDRTDPSLTSQLATDNQEAAKARVQGTPTLIMEGPKGQAQVPSAIPSYQDLQQAIQAVA